MDRINSLPHHDQKQWKKSLQVLGNSRAGGGGGCLKMCCKISTEYIIITFYLYVINIGCHVSFLLPFLLNTCTRNGGKAGTFTNLTCSTFKGPRAQTVGDLGLDILFSFSFFSFCLSPFLDLHPRHMEVSRLGV